MGLILLLSSPLLAFKDSLYLGLSSGVGGVSEVSESKKTLSAMSASSIGLKVGNDFNIDRAHLYHIRWEGFLDHRMHTVKDQYEKSDGWHVGASVLFGRKLDLFLNDAVMPFIKVGYGFSQASSLGEGSEVHYGTGIIIMNNHFEVSLGIDQERRAWDGWMIRTAYFEKSAEHNYHSYIMTSWRF
jgi:hypothetical protein